MKFKGKVAIVTGGAQGIGGAYARLLAEDGARVIIADVNVERGRALARDITAAGGSVVAGLRPTRERAVFQRSDNE